MKSKKIQLCARILPMCCLLFSGHSNAADEHEETIVVTASHFSQPVSTVLMPTIIITRSDIDHWQAKSVPEVLEHLPGIAIGSNGGVGQLTSIFVRGTDSRHVLLLIDGIRMASRDVTGVVDFSQIPVALIQRIEYIRGPYSATYGSDAIGGVINIITESDELSTRANVSYGSYSYQNYNLSSRQKITNKTVLAIAGGYEATAGYDVYPSMDEPDKDGFRSRSIWLGLTHQFSDELTGFIRGYGYSNSTEYDGSIFSPQNERQLYSRNFTAGLQLRKQQIATQLTVSYQKYKDNNYIKTEPLRNSKPINIEQESVHLGQIYYLNLGMFSGGIDFYQERAKENSSLLANHSRKNTGLYLTMQKQWEDFTVEGAIRSDHNQQYGWHSTWQTAISWPFLSNHTIVASYGTAFNAPSFYQIYNTTWTHGNQALKPEKSTQYEISVEGEYGLVNWRLAGYINNITNMIDIDPIYWNRFINVDKAKIKGIEFNTVFNTGLVRHDIELDYLDARYDGGQYHRRMLARRPHKRFQYMIDANFEDLRLSLAYLYQGRRKDSNYSDYTLGGYSTFDLAASYRIMQGLIVRGKVSNLFDKNYETAYGYPNVGREYSVTLSYEF